MHNTIFDYRRKDLQQARIQVRRSSLEWILWGDLRTIIAWNPGTAGEQLSIFVQDRDWWLYSHVVIGVDNAIYLSRDWLMPFNEVMLLRLEVGFEHAEKLTIRKIWGSSMFRRNDITRMGEPGPYPALRSGRGRRDISSGPPAPRGPPKIRKTNYEKFHNIGILYPGRMGLASTLTISSYVAFSTTNCSIDSDKQQTNKQTNKSLSFNVIL